MANVANAPLDEGASLLLWLVHHAGLGWTMSLLLVVLIVVLVVFAWKHKRKLLKRMYVEKTILLREVFIHMIQNRTVQNFEQQERFQHNFSWWEEETVRALRNAGALPGEISDLTALGHVATGNVLAEKEVRLRNIITRLENG